MKMNFPWYAVVFLCGFLSPACSQSQSKNPNVKTVEVSEFAKALSADKNAVILDVRTKEEYDAGHLKGAVLMDFYLDDFKEKISKLDKSRHYYVYCAVGGRSGDTKRMMEKSGFTYVYDMKGGFDDWKNKQPFEKTAK